MKKILLILMGLFVAFTNYAQIQLWGMTYNGGQYNNGVIYQYDVTSSTYTTKYSFDGATGASPKGDLLKALDGKLYGLTLYGGVNGKGVLFQYDPATSTYIKKIDFDGNNGSSPIGSLIQATDGKLYGATEKGGINDLGVIFQYDLTTSTLVKKVDFNGLNGSYPSGSLVQATDGMLYGTTTNGGTSVLPSTYSQNVFTGMYENEAGVLYQYNPSTSIMVKKYNFKFKGNCPVGSLIQANDGKLYGMTKYGLTDTVSHNMTGGVLYQFNISSSVYSPKLVIPYDGGLGATGVVVHGSNPNGSLIQGADGKLYGLTPYGTPGYAYGGLGFGFNTTNSSCNEIIKLLNPTIMGTNPYGSLMQASNGKMYGTTYQGGANSGGGILFQVDPAIGTSSYGQILGFNGNNSNLNGYGVSNGKNPYGSLIEVSSSSCQSIYTSSVNLVNCSGSLIDVPFTINGQFPVGNVFTAQLYDHNNPTLLVYSIGTLTSISSGTIHATIPLNVPTGTDYRIRVLCSNGGVTSIDNGSPIKIDAMPNVTANATSTNVCTGGDVILYGGGTGAVNYLWTGGIQNGIQFTPTSSSNYTVTGSSTNGCSKTATINVSINPSIAPILSINSSTTTVCLGNPVVLTASGANTYTWTGGVSNGVIFNPTSTKIYTVTGTGSNGCSNIAIITVTVNNLPVMYISSNATNVCAGVTLTLSANGVDTFTWSTGQSTPEIAITPTVTTTYSLIGSVGQGCTNTAVSTITVSNCVGPQLTGVSCGITLTALNQALYFTNVPGATNYRLEIIDATQPFSVVNVRGSNVTLFYMSWISGIQYGRTYNIRIAAYVGGLWQPYGNVCTVTTPDVVNIPTTQFSTNSCNVTLGSLNQTLNFSTVLGATNYKFEIINAAQSFSVVNVRNNTLSYFNLSWVSGIQYGRTYDIRISAYVNTVWQPYGSICSITTPSTIPLTQLTSTVCNQSVPTRGTLFTFDPVSGASNYKLQIVNSVQSMSVTNIRNTTNTSFALSYVSTTQVGKTYDITVSALVGGVWGTYGSVCQVTALSAKGSDAVDFSNSKTINHTTTIEEESFNINIYPNPSSGLFNVETNSESIIIVINSLGQEVVNEKIVYGINSINIINQPSGIYFVKVIQDGKQRMIKLIKE